MFAEFLSATPIPELYGMDNGKTIGTHVEAAFNTHIERSFSYDAGNAASGIDFPGLNVDLTRPMTRERKLRRSTLSPSSTSRRRRRRTTRQRLDCAPSSTTTATSTTSTRSSRRGTFRWMSSVVASSPSKYSPTRRESAT